MPKQDILATLNRWLAVTPETALTAPPMRRRELEAAVTEIRTLRERVAQLEQQLRDAGTGSN
jgi:hypothetical protein